MNHYQQTTFLKSVVQLTQLPAGEERIEIAFAGRSNAGKSSAINTICAQKKLVKTSKTPGRTREINLFPISTKDNEQRCLVDLPGYGYAKVAKSMRNAWQKTLSKYLQTRQCLTGLVLVMDIRHPLTEHDESMLNWAIQGDLRIHILLSKADKLKKGPAKNTLLTVQQRIVDYGDQASVQLFSSLKNTGVTEARNKLDQWFNFITA